MSYDFMITSNGKVTIGSEFQHVFFIGSMMILCVCLFLEKILTKERKWNLQQKWICWQGFIIRNSREFYWKILESEKDINDKCVFIIIDVDQFKLANDYWGHSFGDKLLLKITEKLKKYFRSTDIIGRFGGDEFLVFLQDFYSIEWLKEKLNGLNEILTEDIEAEGKICRISVSIGAAVYPKWWLHMKRCLKGW